MPTIHVSIDSLMLLAAEAKRLGVTVKDAADLCINAMLGTESEKVSWRVHGESEKGSESASESESETTCDECHAVAKESDEFCPACGVEFEDEEEEKEGEEETETEE